MTRYNYLYVDEAQYQQHSVKTSLHLGPRLELKCFSYSRTEYYQTYTIHVFQLFVLDDRHDKKWLGLIPAELYLR